MPDTSSKVQNLAGLIYSKLSKFYYQLIDKKNHNKSYSQCGEDRIIDFLFMWLGINEIRYLDIGAHHPSWLSNTYYFYKKGHNGVLIEPDQYNFKKLIKSRPRDMVLNIAIGDNNEGELNFYIMKNRSLNTFDKDQVKDLENNANEFLDKVEKIRMCGINELAEKYFSKTNKPNFVSLDVEGMDLSILKSWDFEEFHPAVLCVETLTYSKNNDERKISEIIDFLKTKRYKVYADTYINTIFVCEKTWRNRKKYA